MNETHPSIEEIIDYLHGELAAAEDAALHAHLAVCDACDRRRAEEVALTEALRAHARAAERAMPAALVAGIRHGVKRRRPLDEWLPAVLRPVVVVPAAAVLAVILYAGSSFLHERAASQATIDPAFYVQNHAAMAATAPFADDVPMLTSEDASR
jgi:anti-sigma factor RsiW